MSRFEGIAARSAVTSATALAVLMLVSACGQKPAEPAGGAAKPAAAAAEMPAGHPAMPGGGIDPTKPHPAPNVAYAAADLSGIAKAEGGQTVAELFEHKDHLAGKPVKVRGKVVKVNANIMDKTWVHLRDGTGAEGKNDVTVTTSGPVPPIGQTALVEGTLAADKDLGMGYKYEVIIENATIKAE